nr:TetR/AcrR family transcriptional regulator [Pseudonocardia sp. C8]
MVRAATELFAERGFDATSVQDVVEAAGVTKGAMYHYFASKEDLLFAIYAPVLAMQTARLEKVVSEPDAVERRLHDAAADVVTTSIENLAPSTVFFRSLHHLGEEQQRALRRDRRRYHEMFRGLIEDGQAAGIFRREVSADLSTQYFFGAVHHLPFWYRPDGRLEPREIGAEFADMLLAALRPGS